MNVPLISQIRPVVVELLFRHRQRGADAHTLVAQRDLQCSPVGSTAHPHTLQCSSDAFRISGTSSATNRDSHYFTSYLARLTAVVQLVVGGGGASGGAPVVVTTVKPYGDGLNSASVARCLATMPFGTSHAGAFAAPPSEESPRVFAITWP